MSLMSVCNIIFILFFFVSSLPLNCLFHCQLLCRYQTLQSAIQYLFFSLFYVESMEFRYQFLFLCFFYHNAQSLFRQILEKSDWKSWLSYLTGSGETFLILLSTVTYITHFLLGVLAALSPDVIFFT